MRAQRYGRINIANRYVIIGESEKGETMIFDKTRDKIYYSGFEYNLIVMTDYEIKQLEKRKELIDLEYKDIDLT